MAGGSGKRLYPITKVINKQLLHIYDKPMIYYPLSTLMLLKVREFLIISTADDMSAIKGLLGDGGWLGIKIEYAVQERPSGIPECFDLGRHFLATSDCLLILGDNMFYGSDITHQNLVANLDRSKACLYIQNVRNPEKYGVVTIKKQKIESIIEKPHKPASNFVATGLYYFPNDVLRISENLKPSKRGELEITDINNKYLEKGRLSFIQLSRGTYWYDVGEPDALKQASDLVYSFYKRQGLKISCPEEIAYRQNLITKSALSDLMSAYPQTDYVNYLKTLL